MPMFRAGSQVLYFAHVPKCAGSSMVKYLQDRFGTLAFHDAIFHGIPETDRWSKTSPQHIDAEVLSRLFPDQFVDASFAVVRHPLPRLVSAFHFQLEVERKLPANMDFSSWLKEIRDKHIHVPFSFDNHIRPMAAIVPQGAKVFRLENGTDSVITWLDEQVGNTMGPRKIDRINEHGAYTSKKAQKAQPTDEDIQIIQEVYAQDFERFGYDPQNWKKRADTTLEVTEEKPAKFSFRAFCV